MPWPTRMLIGASEFTVAYVWLLFLLGVIGGAILRLGWRRLRHSAALSVWADALGYVVPWWSRMRYLATSARFSRALSVLLRAGVPAVNSISLAGAASGSAMLGRAAGHAAKRVESGETLGDALRSSRFFARDFCWFISTTEERGAPESGFEHAAEKYEAELEMREHLLVGLLNPIVVVTVGLLICGVMAALYLPLVMAVHNGFVRGGL